jgi:hypothetical protein
MEKSKLALVTGASSGIGAAYAQRFAKDGFDLVVVARRTERLKELAERLQKQSGVHVDVLTADLTDPKGIAKVRSRIEESPNIERVVNNAGFGGFRPFRDLTYDQIDALIDIHSRAVAHLTRAALGVMLMKNSGAVINVSSLMALGGGFPPERLPKRATYVGTKSFMLTFTQTLAEELAQTQVRVQICLPPVVATEFYGGRQTPIPPMQSEDVVDASLVALQRNEVVCIPGLEDPSLIERLTNAQRELYFAGVRPTKASRYGV